jgi:hypothetical protein
MLAILHVAARAYAPGKIADKCPEPAQILRAPGIFGIQQRLH